MFSLSHIDMIYKNCALQDVFLKLLYIKACVLNKAQLCSSSACISGHVLSDKEQN